MIKNMITLAELFWVHSHPSKYGRSKSGFNKEMQDAMILNGMDVDDVIGVRKVVDEDEYSIYMIFSDKKWDIGMIHTTSYLRPNHHHMFLIFPDYAYKDEEMRSQGLVDYYRDCITMICDYMYRPGYRSPLNKEVMVDLMKIGSYSDPLFLACFNAYKLTGYKEYLMICAEAYNTTTEKVVDSFDELTLRLGEYALSSI